MKNLIILLLLSLVGSTFAQTENKLYVSAQDSYDKGDYKDALNNVEKVIQEDSTQSKYFNLLALTYFELQQYQESYDTYSLAIIKFPKESFLYNNRGNLLLSLQERDAAINDFTLAMEVADNDSSKNHSLTNRAAAKIKKRDFNGAYNDLITAYNFDSTDIAILTNLGSLCDEVGKGDETLKYLLKAVEVDSNFHGAYINIGFKYQAMDQHDKAIEYFNKVLAFNSKDAYGYSNRAYSEYKLGNSKNAMKDINKSIKLYPANSYAYRTRALIYLEGDKKDEACLDLQLAIDKGFTQTYGEEVIELKKKNCF